MELPAVDLGDLPLIGRVFAWHPFVVFLFMVLIDFGVINLLMLWEGDFFRPRYRSFLVNDTISIPLMVASSAWLLQRIGRSNPMPQWWQILILVGAFAVSILMEVEAVRKGIFSLSQELSPSKLYHTVIFGLMGYWMFAPLWAVIKYHRPTPAVLLYGAGLILWIWICTHDTQPASAHVNWIWRWPNFWLSHRA